MFSIITITYNRAALLAKAINSVLSQTYSNFELIIIDDGSTDQSEELLLSYNDPRLHYHKYEHLGSLSKLRNLGLQKVSGNYIAFLDSDDLWEPDYLNKLHQAYGEKQISVVVSNANIIEIKGKKTLFPRDYSIPEHSNLLRKKLLDDSFIIYPSCFSFRNEKANFRFNENMQFGDNDFFLRLLALKSAIILKDPLVQITKHDNNLSSQQTYESLFIQAYFEEFKTLDDLLKQRLIQPLLYHQCYSRFSYKLAVNLFRLENKKEAQRYFSKAFIHYPFHLKALIKWAQLYVSFS